MKCCCQSLLFCSFSSVFLKENKKNFSFSFINEKCLLWRKYANFIYISSIILTAIPLLRKQCFLQHAKLLLTLIKLRGSSFSSFSFFFFFFVLQFCLLFATLGIATSMYVNEQMCGVCIKKNSKFLTTTTTNQREYSTNKFTAKQTNKKMFAVIFRAI